MEYGEKRAVARAIKVDVIVQAGHVGVAGIKWPYYVEMRVLIDLEDLECATDSLLRGTLDGALPAEPEKVVAAKRAPVGLKEPEERTLDGVLDVNTPKVDRSTEWTTSGEQPYDQTDHNAASAFARVCVANLR